MAGDRTLLRELLHPDRQCADVRYSLAHARLAPGQASVPHTLRGSEAYYILSGRAVMTIGHERRTVETGTLVYIPPNALQHIENTGDDELAFLCIADPTWQPEDETIAGSEPHIHTGEGPSHKRHAHEST